MNFAKEREEIRLDLRQTLLYRTHPRRRASNSLSMNHHHPRIRPPHFRAHYVTSERGALVTTPWA